MCFCSFHVSSGCRDASVYPSMLHQTSKLFNIAAEMGFNMKLLNIGGGFPGNPEAALTFEKVVRRSRMYVKCWGV